MYVHLNMVYIKEIRRMKHALSLWQSREQKYKNLGLSFLVV